MASTIVLPPSNDQRALVKGIQQAAATNRTLLLQAGIHYTLPGALQTIPIGPQGLTVGATEPKAIIKRPDFSMPAAAPDFNYGLFFIPSTPTPEEVAAAVWKPLPNSKAQFAVVIRGSININNLTIDSNMGNQGLASAPEHAAEHSATLGFAGFRYDAPMPGPNGPRYIYVGFENVTLHDLNFLQGGYADEVWFPPGPGGLFHPNIETVDIWNILSEGRVDPHRGTMTFSAPAHHIEIQNANIYQLHAESDDNWKLAPRKDDLFTPSQWSLNTITTQIIIFSMLGKVVQLNASKLSATAGCQIELTGGKISDSSFTVMPGKAARFFLLDGLTFENVKWLFQLNATGGVDGIMLGARGNDTCIVSFHGNSFAVAKGATSGQLINSVYSATETGNRVTATFQQCKYEAGFESGVNPSAKVALVQERGTWTFAREDFGNLDPRRSIVKGPQPDVVLIIAPSKTSSI